MIYVGSLASFSFFFFSPETTPRETLPEKKKIDRKRPSPQWKKRIQRKGRKNSACIPQWRLLFQLWLVLHTLLSFFPSIYMYTFFKQSICKTFGYQEIQTHWVKWLPNSFIFALILYQKTLWSFWDDEEKQKDWGQTMKLSLNPPAILTLFLKYSHKEKEMDPFRKG